jgi:hypothetical protein
LEALLKHLNVFFVVFNNHQKIDSFLLLGHSQGGTVVLHAYFHNEWIRTHTKGLILEAAAVVNAGTELSF